jgi:threonine dehydratase
VIERLVEAVILVTDAELRAAVKFLLLRLKILVEPSGAAAAAAVLFRKLPQNLASIGVVLSGGNIDFETLAQY